MELSQVVDQLIPDLRGADHFVADHLVASVDQRPAFETRRTSWSRIAAIVVHAERRDKFEQKRPV